MCDTNYKTKIFELEQLNKLKEQNVKTFVENCEKAYQNQIKEIVDDITKNDNIKVILVAGPSSAGKTTTSNLLTKNINEKGKTALVVSLDDFFIDRAKTPKLPDGNYDYENIKSLDIEYFNKFLKDLIENNYALMPVYDFITGTRKKEYIPVSIDNNTIVIFEGIHALNPILINIHQDSIKKIYIATDTTYIYDKMKQIQPVDVRLMRRLVRDVYTRGHSISTTFSMWQNVLDGEIKYIDPYKHLADYNINSSHHYEIYLFAKYLAPLLKSSNCEESKKLSNFLEKCDTLDKSVIPNNSLLQEFLSLAK